MIDISSAKRGDVPQILAFIRGLAEYERLSHLCVATEQSLAKTLFGERPYAEVLIARLDSAPVGYALFFHTYSTFLAKPGLYLEDLFVLPEHRGKGVGKALIVHVAAIAQERDCGRFEWSVLDWNESAIGFYRSIGAAIMDNWRLCRMTEQELDLLAQQK